MAEEADDLKRRLRALPGVDALLEALGSPGPSKLATASVRRAIDTAREAIRKGGGAPSLEELLAAARGELARQGKTKLRPVINATGVMIHTNLGRVPLGARQIAAVAEIAGGYSNLEYELAPGLRGTRYSHARDLLTTLTGAESALVVNNNAAAVLLVLAATCGGREVIISRGELIEIGGEFRIPDVMATSGARLVEVGTTNRTHLDDYERAITADTGAILKVHPSNYRMSGFTASVPARDLVRLARGRGVLLIQDLGSGLMASAEHDWTHGEPLVDVAVSEGADVVTFSGDKLLGGPQCGLILGRTALIDKISKHPLLRALRVDKLTLAALQATLDIYLEGALDELPLWRMASATPGELQERAEELARAVAGSARPTLKIEAVPCRSVSGGGSLPGTELSSWGVALSDSERSIDELARSLRHSSVPVLGRIEDDRLMLDLRTVGKDQDAVLAEILIDAIRE